MNRWEDSQWRQSMRIRLDYTNIMDTAVGIINGVSQQDIEYIAKLCFDGHKNLMQKRESGNLGFMSLPADTDRVGEVLELAEKLKKDFESFVVIGIGGSALGCIALQSALNPPYYNELFSPDRKGLKVYFPDNVDPCLVNSLIKALDLKKTVINVITKSGSTAETLANFLVFREALKKEVGEENLPKHIVVTTDPEKGLLRKLAVEEALLSLEVPPNVGGRFSVLSPVGLLSAAVCGIDIEELIAGAAFMDEICSDEDVTKNPAYMNAALQYLMYQKGNNISVMMPYSQSLKDVADWFRQLWAESLGKKMSLFGSQINVGPTPVNALGATDQHSQVQLYIEGPSDKVITFLTVEKSSEDVTMPASYPEEDALNYLGHRTLKELLDEEQKATEYALTKNNRPNCKIVLPEVNAFTVGQLLYMLQVQTAMAGELFEINAFDQPGVEEGKIATYALMGRKGYEKQRKNLEKALADRNEMII